VAKAQVTLLLDSDVIAYAAAAAHQKNRKWDAETTSVTLGEQADANATAEKAIEEYREKLKATDVIVCLSCASADGFRRAIFPPYKAQRGEKPLLLAGVKDWMRETYPCYERPSLEADDIMGILSTHPTLVPGKKISVSIDKDMESIPGFLFNPQKDKTYRFISEAQADYKHLMQTLTGDPTDNYPGCPGIGKVKAEKLLANPPSPWGSVVNAYVLKGLTEEDALLQARVARICRHTDYDFKRKEVILWTPPE
jgi:DNA polymerase-1